MMYSAAIRFGRAFDPHVIRGPVRGGGALYDARGVRQLEREIPVVIDHDLDEQIGVTTAISRVQWPGGPWLLAHCRLDDPPGWIKPGTPASFCSRPLLTRQANGWQHITDFLIEEISVVSARMTPGDPGAQVALLRETAGEEIIAERGQRIVRYFDNAVVGIR